MMMNPNAGDTNAPKATDIAPVKSYPKTNYIRNKSLLKVVAAMSCQRCGHHESQAAHSNWHGGKGRGIKASDNYVAAFCQSCHQEIDAGNLMTKAERMHAWYLAHIQTIHYLQINNLWPKGVPLTDLYLNR